MAEKTECIRGRGKKTKQPQMDELLLGCERQANSKLKKKSWGSEYICIQIYILKSKRGKALDRNPSSGGGGFKEGTFQQPAGKKKQNQLSQSSLHPWLRAFAWRSNQKFILTGNLQILTVRYIQVSHCRFFLKERARAREKKGISYMELRMVGGSNQLQLPLQQKVWAVIQ